jgi:polyhydroxyalkanoate synthesis repressor PhaR
MCGTPGQAYSGADRVHTHAGAPRTMATTSRRKPKTGADSSGESAAQGPRPRVLKKYPNRRLYDTQGSCYITLQDVKDMVLQGQDFQVLDAKTAEDITRSILLQIILEEETDGVPIFSTQMLAQLIRFYGHAMQGLMGAYLEKNLQTFVELQTRLAQPAKGLYDPAAFTPEAWTTWLQGQSPNMMQNLMGQYLEQSGSLFAQMQEQLQRISAGLFAGMPGFPGKSPTEP